MAELLHVIEDAAWRRSQAEGGIDPPPLGFIHLCEPGQLTFVLRRHFAGRIGLLVLTIDPVGLDVRYEPSEPGMPPFPHLYGRLELSAVRRVETA